MSQVKDEVQSTATIVPSLPSGVQSSASSGMLKWMKGKGSKFQRKFERLNRRNLAGRDNSQQDAAEQDEERRKHHDKIVECLQNCKAELSGAKVGGAGSNCHAFRLHASAQSPSYFRTAPQAGSSPSKASAPRAHQTVPSPQKAYELIEVQRPEDVQAVLSAARKRWGSRTILQLPKRSGANREILPEDRKYILCTVDWEVILPDPNLCPVLLLDHYVPLTSGFGIVFWPSYAYMLLGSIAKLIDRLVLTFASQSQKLRHRRFWRHFAENTRNRVGMRWMLFTLNICPEKAAQAVVLDTHTPTKFRQANPPDILSAGDAVDGMEEWLRIIQRHCWKEVCRHGVTVVTGRGLDSGGLTYKAAERRLAALMQQRRLVSKFQGDGGAFIIWLLPIKTT